VDEKSRVHRIKTQKEPDCPAILLNFARGSIVYQFLVCLAICVMVIFFRILVYIFKLN